VQSPLRWRDDADWKLAYSDVDRLTAEDIEERRREFDAVKATIKAIQGGP
jgi:hypothetical protein